MSKESRYLIGIVAMWGAISVAAEIATLFVNIRPWPIAAVATFIACIIATMPHFNRESNALARESQKAWELYSRMQMEKAKAAHPPKLFVNGPVKHK